MTPTQMETYFSPQGEQKPFHQKEKIKSSARHYQLKTRQKMDVQQCVQLTINLPRHKLNAWCVRIPHLKTWPKAIRAVNYVGWTLPSVENVYDNYPKSEETPKGYLN